MAEDDDAFDVIIIGGGFAGLSAAYRLAKAEKSVLVVERGPYCGAKTLTGGRIYAYALKALLGPDWKAAPLQREVRREAVMMLTEQDAVTVDSSLHSISEESYTVLSSPLVGWLGEQVEDAGGLIVTGSTVDGLVVRDGRVCGVTTGDEELLADLIIDCEGINPLVLERAGLVRRVEPGAVAVGAKAVFALGEDEVNRRFGVSSGTGVAMLGMGTVTKGVVGGVFLYTNTDSVSLGLVVDSAGWKARGAPLLETVEDVKQHPAISRYLEGADLVEYGAHLVYEGGFPTLPQLSGNGWMVGGDAAGFCLNRGFTIRGMDYAVMSGIAAADTAIEALEAGDVSAAGLAGYRRRLSEGVLKDLETLKGGHSFMARSTDLFTTYPQLAVDFMKDLYHVGPEPLHPVGSTAWRMRRRVKLISTARTVLAGMRSL